MWDDARRRLEMSALESARVQFGEFGVGQSRDWTSHLRGGFGPKSARSFGGDARSPVDCIKRRVPGHKRELLSEKTEKKLLDDKNKESINASSGSARLVYNDARRRGSETVTRGHREPEVFRIMKDARLSVRTSTPRERLTLHDLARFNEEKKKTCRSSSFIHARAAPLSRLETRRSRVAAHALVTFAASMSVTALWPRAPASGRARWRRWIALQLRGARRRVADARSQQTLIGFLSALGTL